MHHDEQGLLSLWEDWHWDDSKGGWLHPDLCGKARREEVVYIRRTTCMRAFPGSLREAGKRPIKTRWATDKGQPGKRAREVGREGVRDTRKARAVRFDAAVGGAESRAVRDCHRRAQRKGPGTRRRAKGDFYAPSRRRAFVEVPPEAYQGSDEPMCGLLRLASTLSKPKLTRGIACSCVW